MTINADVIKRLQEKYSYLINYESNNPSDPIDPLTYVDSGGDSLLHIAAQLGDVETILILIGAGLDVNRQGDMGFTALHYAYEGGHQSAVDALLAGGASADIENEFGKLPGE